LINDHADVVPIENVKGVSCGLDVVTVMPDIARDGMMWADLRGMRSSFRPVGP
jgi:hypothetical protein